MTWSHPRRFLLACVAVVCMEAHGGALIASLTDADTARALRIGISADAARALFHAPYILPVTDDTIERIEVVTEFRRYVLAAEEQTRLGNWTVARGSRSLAGVGIADTLKPWKGRTSIQTRLRFHPLNTYRTVPLFENVLGVPGLPPLETTSTPLLGMASPKAEKTLPPMLGAVVETVFDATLIGQSTQAVRIMLDGRELARVTVDFSRLE